MKPIILIIISLFLALPMSAVAQDNGSTFDNLVDLQAKRNISLDESLRASVVATCDAQKQKIKTFQDQNDEAITKRMVAYSDIQKEIKALEIRLNKQGTDASELDLLIGSLDQQIDELRKVGQEYTNISNDLIVIDCKQNPDLFVAGLDEIRDIRKRTLEVSTNLKRTVTNSPNSTFNPLIERLLI